jgi:antitoxin VapB
MVVTAELFENGKSQAVRLPKAFRFEGGEVLMKKIGEAVVLFPKDAQWDMFLAGLVGFSDDFMADGRGDTAQPERMRL